MIGADLLKDARRSVLEARARAGFLNVGDWLLQLSRPKHRSYLYL